MAATDGYAPAGLEGVWNLRDLGGLPTREGLAVRPGQLLRSATLWYASPADRSALTGLGIATVLDLRDGPELAHHPDRLSAAIGARHRHLPFAVPAHDTGRDDHAGIADPASGERYLRLLESNASTVAEALAVVADGSCRPVLFHCAAGKDRTGLLAALVLACLDVESDAVVADYLASQATIDAIIDRFRTDTYYGPASARVPGTYRMSGLAMQRFLELMGGTQGVRHWALRHALTASQLAGLQRDLLIAAPAAPTT